MAARIIKREDVQGAPVEAAEALLDRPVRLSRDYVNVKAAPREADDRPEARTRVLRGVALRHLTSPYEVEVPEWQADLPLPRDQRRPQEAPSAEPAPADSAPEPEPSPDVETLRAEWEEASQERLDAAVAQAREEGIAEGRAQAEAELAADYQEQLQVATQAIERMEQAWAEHIEASTPLLTELAVEVAEMLLDAPLPKSIKSASARAIAEAVEELAGESSIIVALHPVEYQRLQEHGIVDQLDSVHAELRWDPNPNLAEGDWIVEAPSAVIQRVREDLVNTLRNRLGLLSLSQKYGK